MRSSFRRRELLPLSVPRTRAAGVLLHDGRVAAVGGGTRRESEPAGGECEVRCWSSDAVDVVDVARGLVTPGPALREARESARAVSVGGRILVMDGIADRG